MNETSIAIEEAENGIKIAKISGQLDESNVDEKIQELYKAVEATPKGLKLLFDLENLEYMNSKSIGYLTDLYGKITEAGGKVVIAKAKPNIIDILQVVGLTQLINSYDTTEEAKTALAGDGTPAPEAPPEEKPAEAPTETPTEAPTEEKPAEAPTEEAPEAAPTPEVPVEEAPEAAPTPETPAETPATPVVEAPAPTAEPAPTPETPAPSENPAPAAPQEEGGTYKFE